MRCPCCGSEVAELPLMALLEIEFGPRMRRIVVELARRYPRGITIEDLIWETYQGTDEPEHAKQTLMVLIGKIRARLEPLGWQVISRAHAVRNGGIAMYRLRKTDDGSPERDDET